MKLSLTIFGVTFLFGFIGLLASNSSGSYEGQAGAAHLSAQNNIEKRIN